MLTALWLPFASGLALRDRALVEELLEFHAPRCTSTCDGIQFEYPHITRDRGLRVYMNNPNSAGPWSAPWVRVVQRFLELQTE
jgi:hypothetical protein